MWLAESGMDTVSLLPLQSLGVANDRKDEWAWRLFLLYLLFKGLAALLQKGSSFWRRGAVCDKRNLRWRRHLILVSLSRLRRCR